VIAVATDAEIQNPKQVGQYSNSDILGCLSDIASAISSIVSISWSLYIHDSK